MKGNCGMHSCVRAFITTAILVVSWSTFADPVEEELRMVYPAIKLCLPEKEMGERRRDYLLLNQWKIRMASRNSGELGVVRHIQEESVVDHPVLQKALVNQTRFAWDEWLNTQSDVTPDTLSDWARQLANDIPSLEENSIPKKAIGLNHKLVQIGSTFNNLGTRSQGWKDYLLWHDLGNQLESEKDLDPHFLLKTSRRYEVAATLLKNRLCGEVSSLLRKMAKHAYLEATREDEIRRRLATLVQILHKKISLVPNSTRKSIAHTLGWLDQRGLAEEFVEVIRRKESRPNLFLGISRKLLGYGLPSPGETSVEVDDFILGMHYLGTSLAVGGLQLKLMPDNRRIAMDFVYQSQVDSTTSGFNDKVTLRSYSKTATYGRKRLFFDKGGFQIEPAFAQATNRSEINSVRPRRLLGRRRVEREVYQRRSVTEQVVVKRAERYVREELDKETVLAVEPLQRWYRQNVFIPFVQAGNFPEKFQGSSLQDSIFLTITQATPFQLAAPTSPPELENEGDLSLRFHVSLINNLAASLLAGQTIVEARLADGLQKRFGWVPKGLQVADRRRAWTMTFQQENPLTMEIGEGSFVVRLRADRFTVGDTQYPGMRVSAAYGLTGRDLGMVVRRQGRLRIVPTDFNPEIGERLGVRQQVFVSMLRKRFDRIFPDVLTVEEFILPEPWRSSGTLQITTAVVRENWLTLQGQWTDAISKIARNKR